MRPKRHLRVEEEGLGLLNRDRVKVNPASEFPGHLSDSLGHRRFISKAGQKQ